jgi:ribosomal protein S12 methylthiotransferase
LPQYALGVPGTFYLETLGCPKNRVDSDKLAGTLLADGFTAAGAIGDADLVVVNTCAFIETAREESIETILDCAEARRPGARLVVTGCLAERYGAELAAELPEVDLVAGFGVPVQLRRGARHRAAATGDAVTDLLELPRPRPDTPWAYVKVAEGCDRHCGFCAIPSFRGRQRSRPLERILAEIEGLGVAEVVLVAQDLASYGRDRAARTGTGSAGAARSPGPAAATSAPILELIAGAAALVRRIRLLYLYPSSLDDAMIDAVIATGVPYFDLSLQHASQRLLRTMRRPGGRAQFLERIARIRRLAPDAALRSSFIVGYPGETEADHDELLEFLVEAELDWAGLFTYSREEGTRASVLGDVVPSELAEERRAECSELQDAITARRRTELIGTTIEVLVDEPGAGRSHREAPEIDGVVQLDFAGEPGTFETVRVVGALGPDLEAVRVP